MNKLLNWYQKMVLIMKNIYKKFKFEIQYSILVIVTTLATISILEALR